MIRIASLVLLMIFGITLVFGATTNALSTSDLQSLYSNSEYYWGDQPAACSATGSSSTSLSGGTNLDYAGRPILNQAQLGAIAKNEPVYQQAAQSVGIPWQLLAVIHLRETGLKVENPADGQGIYQFANKQGGPYPAGPVSQDEFLRQSKLAAQFLKNIAADNYSGDTDLSPTSNAATIKDTLFSYNGRAQVYVQQAQSLGYNPATQGYEGSPYVMNKADAKRDPSALGPNETSWGQIKTDGGAISYPANNDYGAFVEYAALTGISIGGDCSSGSVNCSGSSSTSTSAPLRQQVVCLTLHELSLWQAGKLRPGLSSFGKYSQNNDWLWCADFVSWIYNEAGYPLRTGGEWRVDYVPNIATYGAVGQRFVYHVAGTYTPQPGDIVIHLSYPNPKQGHTNIVTAVNGNIMTLTGGDQPPTTPLGYPDGSVVSSYQVEGFSNVDGITGYVSPK